MSSFEQLQNRFRGFVHAFLLYAYVRKTLLDASKPQKCLLKKGHFSVLPTKCKYVSSSKELNKLASQIRTYFLPKNIKSWHPCLYDSLWKKAYISTYFTVLLGVTCKLAVGFIIRTAFASLACWKNESGTQKSETASGSSSKGSSKSDVLSLRSIQWCATLSSRTSSYLRKKKIIQTQAGYLRILNRWKFPNSPAQVCALGRLFLTL